MLLDLKVLSLTSQYSNKDTHLKDILLKIIHLRDTHLKVIHLKATLQRSQFMFNKLQLKKKVTVIPAWSACYVAVSLKCVVISFDYITVITVIITKADLSEL